MIKKQRSVTMIIHVMKNGERRTSLKGYIVPMNEETKELYIMQAKIISKANRK